MKDWWRVLIFPKDKCLWSKLEICKLSGLALLSAIWAMKHVTAAHFSVLPLISHCVFSLKDIWSSLEGSYLQTQFTWKKLLLNKLIALFLYWNWVTLRVLQHKQENCMLSSIFPYFTYINEVAFKTLSQRSLNVLVIIYLFGPWALCLVYKSRTKRWAFYGSHEWKLFVLMMSFPCGWALAWPGRNSQTLFILSAV